MKRIETFNNIYLRRILQICWPVIVSEQELWQKTRQQPVEEEIPVTLFVNLQQAPPDIPSFGVHKAKGVEGDQVTTDAMTWRQT